MEALGLSRFFLPLAVLGGTVAVFVLLFYGWAPAVSRWRAYHAWITVELRGVHSSLKPSDFAIRHIGIILLGAVTGYFLTSTILYPLLFGAICAYLPVVWLGQERKKRRESLDEQLDTTLQSLASTILVTQNLEDAFATVAQHFDPPMSQEADILVKQVRLGTPMDEALHDMAMRCQSRNIDAIVTALTVGRQTGGDLPKVLETTAHVMREQMRVEGMMQARTAEGKMQGIVMGALPFVFGLALEWIDPEWMYPLFHDPIGWGVLTIACVMEFAGVIMVRKVTRLDA